MRLEDDRTIAPGSGTRRICAGAVYRVGVPLGLLAFAFADTHVHIVTVASRLDAGELARRIEISLQKHLRHGVRFEPARVRPVVDQWHLYRTLPYVFRQVEHHTENLDPTHDGTSLPELVGMRFLDSHTPRLVRALLPRLDISGLREWVGLLGRGPVDTDPQHLADAAAAAFGLPTLSGLGSRFVRARTAAVQAEASRPTASLAQLLGMHPERVRCARHARRDERAIEAVRNQLLARAPPVAIPSQSVGPRPLLPLAAPG